MPTMSANFEDVKVSVALLFGDQLPYDRAAFQACLQAASEQDHPPVEVVVVDGRGASARPDFIPSGVDAGRVRHLPGEYANRIDDPQYRTVQRELQDQLFAWYDPESNPFRAKS